MAKSSTSFTASTAPKSGRPKGTQNKVTVQAKEAFLQVMDLLEKRMTDGDDVINSLSPARAAELYLGLLNYIKPKLSQTKSDTALSGDIKITVKYQKAGEINE